MALSKTQQFHCAHCGGERAFRKPATDHGLHAALTVCTLGAWAAGWAWSALRNARRAWRCRFCGRRHRPERAATRQAPVRTAAAGA